MGKAARKLQRRRDGSGPPPRACATANRPKDPATAVSNVVYDAAVLVNADKNNRSAWAEHKARLELGLIPSVPTVVIAQVSRSPQQVQLRRFLTGCAVVPLDETEAHEAGRLLGRTRTVDIVDAVVVTVAVRKQAIILTGDPADIKRLVRAFDRLNQPFSTEAPRLLPTSPLRARVHP